jgi:gamma-butyrobetaine dioxygenase
LAEQQVNVRGRDGDLELSAGEPAAVGELGALFDGAGAAEYLGEPVTIGVHMRQAAALARESGATDALVAAALLHDVGHLLDATSENEQSARHGVAESARTLAVQGGPMTPDEAAEFAAGPYARDALTVRRWDEAAKDPARTPPAFADFATLLDRLRT